MVVILWTITGILLLIGVAASLSQPTGHRLSLFLFLMLIVSLLFIFFGFVNPRLVLFGSRTSRLKAAGLYGALSAMIIILVLITSPQTDVKSAAINGSQQKNPTHDAKQTINIAEFKKQIQKLSYLELARNPEKLTGTKVSYTGKIVQTLENDNRVAIRVNVTKDEIGIWKDTIFVNYQRGAGADRLLENDVIQLWGTVKGLTTYDAVLGQKISIPEIDAVKIALIRHE